MIFQQPWAWLGLLAIALPVAAHLLARRPARRQPFPDLRFLPASAFRPVKRDRIADAGLLALRAAIVAAAAAALAAPLWLSASRASARDAEIARAIVVDGGRGRVQAPVSGTDAATPAPAGGLVDLVAEAARGATIVRVAETADVRVALRRAVNWLRAQPTRGEIVVISAFATSALGRADVEAVPAEIGLRFVRDRRSRESLSANEPTTTPGTISLLTSTAQRAAAEAARQAAATTPGWPEAIRADRPIAIVFPEHESRAALASAARPLDQPWMRGIFFDILADPMVRAAAAADGTSPRDWLTAARGAGDAVGAGSLLLFVDRPTASVSAAAAIGAVARAVSADAPSVTAATDVHSDATLVSWERAPAGPPPDATPRTDTSDGRWVWILVLVLLSIEAVVRRRRSTVTDAEVDVARVA